MRPLSLAVIAANTSSSISASCSERRSSSFGDGVVLLARATAHADGAHNFSIAFQGNAPGEDHDFAIVGDMNAEKLSARLRMCGQVPGGDIEGTRGVGLLHGNIDAADPRAIHANVRHDVCLLYTSDAADEEDSVDLGGRRIIKT